MERISIWNPRWLGSKLASRPITATRLTEDNLWSASRLDQTFPGSLTRLLYVETISSKGMTRAVSGEESAAAFVPPLSAAFLIWKINSLNMYKCIQQVNVRGVLLATYETNVCIRKPKIKNRLKPTFLGIRSGTRPSSFLVLPSGTSSVRLGLGMGYRASLPNLRLAATDDLRRFRDTESLSGLHLSD